MDFNDYAVFPAIFTLPNFSQCNALAEKLQDELQLSVQELAKVHHESVVFL